MYRLAGEVRHRGFEALAAASVKGIYMRRCKYMSAMQMIRGPRVSKERNVTI